MAVLAQGLPILFVPEKPHVAAMGHDMVHHSRRGQLSIPSTLRTQRISLKVGASGRLPAAIIAPCGSVFPGIQGPMCLAVDLITEGWTARMTAGALRFHRHNFPHNTSKPRVLYTDSALL